MHRSANTRFILGVAVCLLMASSCSREEKVETSEPAERVAQAQPAKPAAGTFRGIITETMDSGGYTYVHIDMGDDKVWAAGPETSLMVGQEVGFKSTMPMRNFQSKTLDRTFDVVYFTDHFHLDMDEEEAHETSPPQTAKPKSHSAAEAASPGEDLSGMRHAPGGWTIAQLYEDKAELAGKPVVVRGKVVKAIPNIMGRNWLHIQDGTGETGTDDLTITTESNSEVGSTVLVRGVLTTDKDFGSGYFYDLIIENAEVLIE